MFANKIDVVWVEKKKRENETRRPRSLKRGIAAKC